MDNIDILAVTAATLYSVIALGAWYFENKLEQTFTNQTGETNHE
jgi:hypothetical protein